MDTLPRIKGIKTLPNYRLSVVFDDGQEVVYDVGEDIEQVDEFRMLKQIPHLWEQARVDSSRTCVYWNDRIDLHHIALQDYEPQHKFDAIVCNPPYFDKSLECPSIQRQRARHTSSLPFDILISRSYHMLDDGGHLSVILPPEVLDNFCNICYQQSFHLTENNIILSLPDNPPKRHILVFRKTNSNTTTTTNTYCMLNPDHSYSQWFKLQLQDFLIGQIYQPE